MTTAYMHGRNACLNSALTMLNAEATCNPDELPQQGIRLHSIDFSHFSLSASCLLKEVKHIFGEHSVGTIHLQSDSTVRTQGTGIPRNRSRSTSAPPASKLVPSFPVRACETNSGTHRLVSGGTAEFLLPFCRKLSRLHKMSSQRKSSEP